MSETTTPQPYHEKELLTATSGRVDSTPFADNQSSTGYGQEVATFSPGDYQETLEKVKLTRPELEEMLEDGQFMIHFSYFGQVNPLFSVDHESGSAGHSNYASSEVVRSNPLATTDSYYYATDGRVDLFKEFNDIDVSEIVTVKQIGKVDYDKVSWNQYEPNPSVKNSHDGEKVMSILYETVTRLGRMADRAKFLYKDAFGRSGNSISFRLILPESSASTFVEAMHDDPEIIRTALDVIASKVLNFEDDSARKSSFTPDYESWRDSGGGVSRIALRTRLDAGPEQSEILEF